MQREKPSSARGEAKTRSRKTPRYSLNSLDATYEKGAVGPAIESCESCGAPMARKFGRFGEFMACTNYPKCKTTRGLAKVHDGAGDEVHAEDSEEICETCRRPMAIKRGRFGEFLACTGFPECKSTRRIQKRETFAGQGALLQERCPRCVGHLVLKKGRRGPFTACSNYPKCEYVKQDTTGVRCPECGVAELVIKKGKRGPFYGCANYPACKFTLRDIPVPQSCPECGARFVVERLGKDGSRQLQCRTSGCGFKETLPEAAREEP